MQLGEVRSSMPLKSHELEVSQEGDRCARGQGGKKDKRWTLMIDIARSEPELMDRVKQILQDLQDELCISHLPYKRQKRSSPAKLELGDFWHVNHGRKFGATLSCPFASTTQLRELTSQYKFKIIYRIKNIRMQLWTLNLS